MVCSSAVCLLLSLSSGKAGREPRAESEPHPGFAERKPSLCCRVCREEKVEGWRSQQGERPEAARKTGWEGASPFWNARLMDSLNSQRGGTPGSEAPGDSLKLSKPAASHPPPSRGKRSPGTAVLPSSWEGLGTLWRGSRRAGIAPGKGALQGADPGRGSAASPGAGLIVLEELLLPPAPCSPHTPFRGEEPREELSGNQAEWQHTGLVSLSKTKLGASHN